MKWKVIPGFSKYSVSDTGLIRSANGILKPRKRPDGYMEFWPYKNGRKKHFFVHRAVALAFIGPANDRHVDHINRNRSDNRISNIRYLSKLENSQRSKINILNSVTVKKMRIEFSKGSTVSKLSELYGVSITTVCQALDGTTWGNIGGPLAIGSKRRKG